MNSLLVTMLLLPQAVGQPPAGPPSEQLPAPIPVRPLPPQAIPNPVPFPPAPPVVVIPTLDEFARCFVPTPGIHEVTVIHPVSKRPVTFCFTLPDCPPRKVQLHNRRLVIDYGNKEVRVIFRILCSKVDVQYAN